MQTLTCNYYFETGNQLHGSIQKKTNYNLKFTTKLLKKNISVEGVIAKRRGWAESHFNFL